MAGVMSAGRWSPSWRRGWELRGGPPCGWRGLRTSAEAAPSPSCGQDQPGRSRQVGGGGEGRGAGLRARSASISLPPVCGVSAGRPSRGPAPPWLLLPGAAWSSDPAAPLLSCVAARLEDPGGQRPGRSAPAQLSARHAGPAARTRGWGADERARPGVEEPLGTPGGSGLSLAPPHHCPPARQAAAQVLPPVRLEKPQPQSLREDRPPQLSSTQGTQIGKSRVKTAQGPAAHGEAAGGL